MLDHLGYPKAHDAIVKAIETVIAETTLRTPDIGGKTKTSEMGKAIADAI
jgi:tartrate dehydrogenase/decarboxylase/D-malate dehydrogenase